MEKEIIEALEHYMKMESTSEPLQADGESITISYLPIIDELFDMTGSSKTEH